MSSSNNPKYPRKQSQLILSGSTPETDEAVGGETPIYLEEIEGHIERHIGPVKLIYHDLDSTTVPFNILVVPATSDRRFHYLVTAGISDMLMSLEPHIFDHHEQPMTELVLALPPEWPINDEEVLKSENWFYPISHLKRIAHMPSEMGASFSQGYSIVTADPAKPIGPDCDMIGFVLDHPWIAGEAFSTLKLRGEDEIEFFALYPIHAAEMSYKTSQGYGALKQRFEDGRVTEIFDPKRPSLTADRSWWQRFLDL